MNCYDIETPLYRQLCQVISGDISGAEDFLAGLIGNQGTQTRNFVSASINALYGFIGNHEQITRQQIINSENWVKQTVQSEAGNTRQQVINSQNSIQNQLVGGFQSLAQYLGDIDQNFDGVAEEIITANEQTITTSQNALEQFINEGVNGLTGVVNATSNYINSQLEDIQVDIAQVAETTASAVGDTIGKLGEVIGPLLENLFSPFIAWLESEIERLLGFYGDNVAPIAPEIQEKTLKPHEMLVKLAQGESFDYNKYLNTVAEYREGTGALSYLMFFALLLPNVLSAAGALFSPFAENLRQASNQLNPSKLIDEANIIRGFWRGTLDIGIVADHLLAYGYSPETIHQLLDTSNQILGVGEIRELFIRGSIDKQTSETMLSQLGWTDKDVEHIQSLYEVLPPLQDVIRFAVREVFTPEARELFGLDEDYPEILSIEASKRGLSDENARNYWASHWELPGVNDGFEMFHRGLISRDQLSVLLKAKDFMPFFRDKLINLSYNLATRVDTRRLYQIGVWDRNRVFKEYKNAGYNDEIAEALTQFTEIEYDPAVTTNKNSPKLLARSIIERAFIRGQLNRDEAINKLRDLQYTDESAELILDSARVIQSIDKAQKIQDSLESRLESINIKLYVNGTISKFDAINNLNELGYTDNEAESFLNIAVLERDLSIQDDIVKDLQTAYVERTIDDSELTELMIAVGFSNPEVTSFISQISIYREIRTRKPSLAQIQSFLRNGVINLDQYADELRGLGYHEKYVESFIQEYINKEG